MEKERRVETKGTFVSSSFTASSACEKGKKRKTGIPVSQV